MLADRQYMRRDNMPNPWSVTIVLLVFNILVFFLEYSNGKRSESWFLEYGALSLEGLKRGFIWQFITFQFLHGGLPHLVLELFKTETGTQIVHVPYGGAAPATTNTSTTP